MPAFLALFQGAWLRLLAVAGAVAAIAILYGCVRQDAVNDHVAREMSHDLKAVQAHQNDDRTSRALTPDAIDDRLRPYLRD